MNSNRPKISIDAASFQAYRYFRNIKQVFKQVCSRLTEMFVIRSVGNQAQDIPTCRNYQALGLAKASMVFGPLVRRMWTPPSITFIEGQAMPNSSSQPALTGAIRLIFEYEGDQVRLVSQQPVDMAITGFDITRTEASGFYIDTQDANHRTLARTPAHDAFATSMEVFPEKHGQAIVRVNVDRPKGAFTVVVPAPQQASHVSVVRVAPGSTTAQTSTSRATSPQAGLSSVTELATFPLQLNAQTGEKP